MNACNTTALSCKAKWSLSHNHEECLATCYYFEHFDKAFCFNVGFFLSALGVLICVFGAALAAGLTMGLLSLDADQLKLTMEIQARDCTSPEEEAELMQEKILATKLYPLVKRHHWLLVTLLLLNTLANEALPLCLDEVVPSPIIAIIFAVTFVLMFGEIIPSAIFTGPNQMKIAAALTPLVWFFMFIFCPIGYPIAKLLDCCLHEHRGRYLIKVPELKGLLRAQKSSHDVSESSADKKHTLEASGFEEDEIDLMLGALEIKYVTAEKVMTPLDKTYMLGMHDKLDMDTMAVIISSGHSRIPVYDGSRHNVRGMLIVKRLIVVDPEMKRGVDKFGLHRPLVFGLNENLLDILNQFQKGRHLAIVANDPAQVRLAWKENREIPANVHMAGILTFEDVMERLMGEEIEDESDIGALPKLKQMAFIKARMRRLRIVTQKEMAKVRSEQEANPAPEPAAYAAPQERKVQDDTEFNAESMEAPLLQS